ncbi:MAG: hypothetical protein QW692_03830 [Nitrososphaerota archaeon]
MGSLSDAAEALAFAVIVALTIAFVLLFLFILVILFKALTGCYHDASACPLTGFLLILFRELLV